MRVIRRPLLVEECLSMFYQTTYPPGVLWGCELPCLTHGLSKNGKMDEALKEDPLQEVILSSNRKYRWCDSYPTASTWFQTWISVPWLLSAFDFYWRPLCRVYWSSKDPQDKFHLLALLHPFLEWITAHGVLGGSWKLCFVTPRFAPDRNFRSCPLLCDCAAPPSLWMNS